MKKIIRKIMNWANPDQAFDADDTGIKLFDETVSIDLNKFMFYKNEEPWF